MKFSSFLKLTGVVVSAAFFGTVTTAEINNPALSLKGIFTPGNCVKILSRTQLQDTGIPCPSTTSVSSVFGRTGAIVKAFGDYLFSDIGGSLSFAQLPTFTGDVVNSGAGVTTIQPAAVSNSKLANMGAATVKGTIAGGSPADLTAAQITANFCNLATSSLKGCIIALTNNALQFFGGDGAWHFAQPYNPVTFYGMVCDGSTVTGNTAALQAAINAQPAQGGPVNFPRGICLFDAVVTITGHAQTSFEGLSNANSSGANTPSVLAYTGGNIARAIDARDGKNFTINNLSIYANNSAFVGILIDSGATIPNTTISNGLRVSNFWIGATYTGPAPTCLNIAEAFDVKITSGQFSRCSPAVKGQNILGQNTTTKIEDVVFANHVGPAIIDCGEGWILSRVAIEPDSTGGPNGFSNNVARPCKGMLIDAMWTGDTGATAGTWFTITANGLTVRGGSIGNGTLDFALVGGSGYNFQGVRTNGGGATTFISCSSNPTGIVANGNVLQGISVTNTGTCLDAQGDNNTPAINFPLPFWTPTWTPGGGAYPTTSNLGYYRLHGNGIEYYIKVVFGTVTATGATFVGGFPFAPALDCAIAGTDDNASQHINGLLRAGNFSAGLFKTANPASTPAFSTASNVGLYANCRL